MTVIETTPALSCPLCHETRSRPATAELRDLRGGVGGTWRFATCARCGVHYLDPRPVRPADAYPADYPQHETTALASIEARRPLVTAIRRAVLRAQGYRGVGGMPLIGSLLARVPAIRSVAFAHFPLVPPARVNGTLLDIGCGNGRFLAFARLLGWRTLGIERDPASAAAAQRIHPDPIHPSFDEAAIEEGSMDVVTASHVLEHLDDPRATLAEMRRVLAQDGLLGIAVPNWRSLLHPLLREAWHGLEQPRHLLMFERRPLLALLRECGFDVISVQTDSLRAVTEIDDCWRMRFGRPQSRFERLAFAIVMAVVDVVLPSRGEQIIVWARKSASATPPPPAPTPQRG